VSYNIQRCKPTSVASQFHADPEDKLEQSIFNESIQYITFAKPEAIDEARPAANIARYRTA